MKNTIRIAALLLLGPALALLGACSKSVEPPDEVAAAEPPAAPTSGTGQRSARTLSIPGSELPPGHPPTGGDGQAVSLHWAVPDDWEKVPPASSMRMAQYRAPGPAGDAECVVYYFGPGQGGDAMSNAARWARQFEQPDGSSSIDAMKVTRIEGGQVAVQLVEVTGTYDGGMTMTDAPPERMAGHMLLGGIAEGPDAPWFFKFTGPEGTIRAQRDAFIGMMKSIHTDG